MSHRTLAPVFLGLRIGLHAMVLGLLVLTAVRAVALDSTSETTVALALAAVFAAVYVLGAWRAARPTVVRRTAALWCAVLTLLWIGLLLLVPDAAYLVFPLFFLYLHVLPSPAGPAAVVLTTLITILALGARSGFSVGGVTGPLVGAAVALLIGLGYRALAREAAEREALLAELLATRDRLAAAEREQGVLAERARLAREIHDTVAQSLSSIQMLLHAAEAADGDRPGIEHVRLARTTAADALSEARRFIRELAPPSLEAGLGPALQRLGAQWQRDDLRVEVDVGLDVGAGVGAGVGVDVPMEQSIDTSAGLPMDVRTALLRVAQGALANVVQHARATTAWIVLRVEDGRARLEVHDDGIGFDPAAVHAHPGGTDSFGLRAIAERVDQLGGTLEVDSSPAGTSLLVTLEVDRP